MTHSGKLHGNWLSQLLFTLSLAFLAFGLLNLGWYTWPTSTDALQLTIPKGTLAGAPAGTTYASFSDYSLAISWPRWQRIGKEGFLKVTLTEIISIDVQNQESQSNQVILIEPSLAGMVIDPPGKMQANLALGQTLEMTWALQGDLKGEYPGKVLVSFGFFDESLMELVSVPVAVVDISVRVTSLWGANPQLALWFGAVGLVFWGALFVLGRFSQVR